MERLTEMIAGIEAYQHHPYRRRLTNPKSIWRAGSARLLDYGAAGGVPVFITPSLVNRAYVLDLRKDRSLLRWLAGRGFRPFLLDWGAPEGEERSYDLDAYFTRRLLPAFDAALAAGGGLMPALGYCMGGALTAALAIHRPLDVARIALIGAPWDFSRLEGAGAGVAGLFARDDRRRLTAQIDALTLAFGVAPVDLLQTLFALLDPTLALRKFRAFARLDPTDAKVEMFVALEDWLNDGPPLAGPTTRDLLLGWCLDNVTGKGGWRVGGALVIPEEIATPALAFCSATDRIAPPACAEALPASMPMAEIRRPLSGHVGMIVGARAKGEVWRPLADFLKGE
jgi:polyhydroxyalkanoate synthase